MFQQLSQKFSNVLRDLTGPKQLTEDHIKQALRDVRRALLEADVALPVVQSFIDSVARKALGADILRTLKPGEAVVQIVHEELVRLLGSETSSLNLQAKTPVVILVAGLQGAGKTTSVAKMAAWLKREQGKKVMVASADIYRPAAIEQLRQLALQAEVEFHASSPEQSVLNIAEAAHQAAVNTHQDVLIMDTAGRLHVDEAMMQEIAALHRQLNPTETLFVVDSLTGQDAANTAKAFADTLPLTGVVLTKTEGDHRGGAALSVRHVTGQSIKFMGDGERIADLKPFDPERLASRILGMGDILSLIEDAKRVIDEQQAEKMAKKIKKGQFDLQDFLDQLRQMKQMGGAAAIMDKLPGMGNLSAAMKNKVDDKTFARMEALICAMTPHERRYPDLIKGSRKRRIAQGTGVEPIALMQLLSQFKKMQKMMKLMKGKNMAKMMQKMQGMGFPQ